MTKSAWVGVVLGVMALSGCYKRRTIYVPPTEHGEFCMKDAQLSFQVCLLQQRGVFFCEARRDRELLMCEGAYEVVDGASGPADAGVVETYQLPGYRP